MTHDADVVTFVCVAAGCDREVRVLARHLANVVPDGRPWRCPTHPDSEVAQ